MSLEVKTIGLDDQLWKDIDKKATELGLDRSKYIRKLTNEDLYFKKKHKLLRLDVFVAVVLLSILVILIMGYLQIEV